jgi:hypothetical protein
MAAPTAERIARLNANGLALRAEMDRRHAEGVALAIRQRTVRYPHVAVPLMECGHDVVRPVYAYCSTAGRVAVHHHECVGCNPEVT